MYYQLEYDKCLNANGTFFYKEKKNFYLVLAYG